MELYSSYDEALAALPPYVISRAEAAELDKRAASVEFWREKSIWDGRDGFSMAEFIGPAAAEDEGKHVTRLLDGGMGVFLVLVRLEDGAIVARKPEVRSCFGRPHATEMKWVLRREGRMFRDANGRWAVYPYRPARPSTLAKHGLAERWVVAPYHLGSKNETIGEAMKRGTAVSQLVKVPELEVAA